MVSLAELVLDTQYGTAAKANDVGRGQPVLRMNNLTYEGRFETSDLKWVELTDGEREKLALRHGDLLFNRTNSRELVGKTGVWKGPADFTFAGYLVRVRVREESVLPEWVAAYLNSSEGKATLFHMAKPSINMANISATDLLRLQIPVAPLEFQRRAVRQLERADAIRRKRTEAIALTEELLRSAFVQMVGPRAQGYERWPRARLEELAAATPGSMRTGPFGSALLHSEFVDEGVAVLGIDNAVQNRFAWGERRFVTQEKYEGLRRYTAYPDDVIVTIMGTTGRSAVVPRDIPLAITTKHLATLTLDRSRAEPEFVAQAIHTHPEVLRQIAQANRGAIMSGLNLTLIRALSVPVPPVQVQRSFSRAVAEIRELELALSTASRQAQDLFDSLVADAFRRGNAQRASA
ncbi:hypothetical protein MFUL124B02_36425 [Myxococcus fulvus 124B02]|nr:hypothetical protein MFUL124B02_36425 [Myxococcus fulvus 124B02]